MSHELALLAATAAGIGFLHALLGPDHYLPFVLMGRAGRWSRVKTLTITFFCGVGHVGSSLLLAAGGVGAHRLGVVLGGLGPAAGGATPAAHASAPARRRRRARPRAHARRRAPARARAGRTRPADDALGALHRLSLRPLRTAHPAGVGAGGRAKRGGGGVRGA